METFHLKNLELHLVRDGLVLFEIEYPPRYYDEFFLSIFIDRRFVDVWFPNSTSSKLRNIEHLFEEMDKDNDKIIMPNEVDSDLK